MKIYHKIENRKVTIGGEEPTGWLPSGFAKPLPTPKKEIYLNLEISDDGGGNFLLIYESSDKSLQNDNWHQTIAGAKKQAQEYFGINLDEWNCQST